MKFATALLSITLLIPTSAWAQSLLMLSCDDIVKIEVWRLRGGEWRCPPNDGGNKDGYHYAIITYLTKEAQKRMNQVYEATAKTPFVVDGCKFLIRHVQIQAGGKLIKSAYPTRDNFHGGEGAIITKKTREAAFAAARMICPNKAPTVMLTDGS